MMAARPTPPRPMTATLSSGLAAASSVTVPAPVYAPKSDSWSWSLRRFRSTYLNTAAQRCQQLQVFFIPDQLVDVDKRGFLNSREFRKARLPKERPSNLLRSILRKLECSLGPREIECRKLVAVSRGAVLAIVTLSAECKGE